jgi:hypothetical protein
MMSGPIIRSRSSQDYAKNWSAAFGSRQAKRHTAGRKPPAANKKVKSAKRKP